MLQDKDIPVLDDERLSEEAARDADEGAATPSDGKSLSDQINDLIDDVRALALAETEYYRTKLSVNLAATKQILLLFGIGIIVGIMAIIALILGLLLVLSELVGPLAATAIVTGIALLIASAATSMAIRRAKRLPLDENEPRE